MVRKVNHWHPICRAILSGDNPAISDFSEDPCSKLPGIHDKKERNSAGEGKRMATVIFKFFQANINDEDMTLFIEKMEEVLKRFAGEAYHFRYEIEKVTNGRSSMPQRNNQEFHNGGKHRF